MEASTTSTTNYTPAETWEEHPLISPTKFSILCVFTLGLYGLWWQYKTWRFFKQWQQTDTWPVARAIFSLFTIHELMKTINQFSHYNNGPTLIQNSTELATGYIVLNLLSRLPKPLWLVSLGAFGFLVPAFRAFREAMLQAPAYGGRAQAHFSARQLVVLSLGIVCWGLVIAGLLLPE